eukprot:gnl/TRDRNA2_/TRDRNA2_174293_c0_seq10.p1 gnl/TRDRNA2_/TRDRNA2_174293_c0~~gnl/TRDRNA2_/TRDRNA2_174293_c0_seq10.p1  ORF type:complete len:184 (-),score=42.65 gnl/TRDRNA2_/TRDRNA2_174293_c0_seq10:42-593(-)
MGSQRHKISHAKEKKKMEEHHGRVEKSMYERMADKIDPDILVDALLCVWRDKDIEALPVPPPIPLSARTASKEQLALRKPALDTVEEEDPAEDQQVNDATPPTMWQRIMRPWQKEQTTEGQAQGGQEEMTPRTKTRLSEPVTPPKERNDWQVVDGQDSQASARSQKSTARSPGSRSPEAEGGG